MGGEIMTNDEYIKQITEEQEAEKVKIKVYEKQILNFFKNKGAAKVSALSMSYKFEYKLPRKKLPDFLDAIISFAIGPDGDFSLSWNLVISSSDEIMHYLFGEKLSHRGHSGMGLGYKALKDGKFITSIEDQWLNNRLHISWNIKDIESFFQVLDEFDTKMQNRYCDFTNIIEDLDRNKAISDKFLKESGKEDFIKKETASLSKVALYKFFNQKEKAIKELKNYMYSMLEIDKDTYRYKMLNTYLEYLKYGTPLSYIPSPADKVSLFQLTGNDIYIALNKKTIKNNDILEYFGGKDMFGKPQKTSCEDLNNDSGIAICKVGKWSILGIGIDLFMQFDQEKIGNMLSDMSTKYNRAILCVNQNTTNTFGFEVYKKGEFLRRWMAGDGEVLENMGKPITGEKKRFNDTLKKEQDAESVVEFLDSVLKITYADLEKSKAVLYEMK